MTTLLDLGAVTVADYQLRTGDTATAASAVSAVLVEAEELLDEFLRRHLASEERVDTFRVWPDGRLYPDAWPITVGPAGVSVEDNRTLLGVTPNGGPFVAAAPPGSPMATITWTGGFTDVTLPRTLAHAIYDLAYQLAVSTTLVPAGATSLRVGDVAVSYGTPTHGIDAYLPGLAERVSKWRNRWAG